MGNGTSTALSAYTGAVIHVAMHNAMDQPQSDQSHPALSVLMASDHLTATLNSCQDHGNRAKAVVQRFPKFVPRP
jgi:hypothetical protein